MPRGFRAPLSAGNQKLTLRRSGAKIDTVYGKFRTPLAFKGASGYPELRR